MNSRQVALRIRMAVVVSICISLAALSASAGEPLVWDVMPDTWAATDALGRRLPMAEEVGPPRADRTVGIFYLVWLGNHGDRVVDISRLLRENPTQPQYGPPGMFHWWGEPIWGYYRSDDRYVIRKHAQMLCDAGVDVWFLDATNGFTYDQTVSVVCEVIDQVRRSGQAYPKLAFVANSRAAETVAKLYNNFYAPGKYRELWFYWKGKPLLLAPEEALTDAQRPFFTVRQSWAWTKGQKWFGDGRNKWAWIDHHPQQPGWSESRDRPEQISVCVAQHPVSNIGRSFHASRQPPPEQIAPEKGRCFAEQWERAIRVDPQLVFVSGWNEWVAQRFISKGKQRFLGAATNEGDSFFVDQYNQEFSRDIEPMRGGHGDNYYYQMAAAIRRYKGARTLPPVSRAEPTIDGRFDDWRAVNPEFRDTLGDTLERNHPGYDRRTIYRTPSGRNDLAVAKVALGAEQVYFYVRAAAPLSAPTDDDWMILLIDADADAATGPLGYDLRVNRRRPAPGRALLERWSPEAHQWRPVGDVPLSVGQNELELAVPLDALRVESPKADTPRTETWLKDPSQVEGQRNAAFGATETPRPETDRQAGAGSPAERGSKQPQPAIEFKWTDGIDAPGEAAAFTLGGDAAPNDRFNFRALLGTP